MKKAVILSIAVVAVLFIWSGCSEKATNPGEEEPPLPPIEPISSNAIIPLAIGNQWTYVDSLFYEDSVEVDTYNVRIRSKRHIEEDDRINRNLIWWRFDGWFNPLVTPVEFAAKGDTVYSLQEAWGGSPPNYERVLLSPIEYIIPKSSDTLSFVALTDGDGAYIKKILKKNSLISFAGEIAQNYLMIEYDLYFTHTEIVVPKAGMVYLEVINDPQISGQDWIKFRRVLTDYTFSEPE